MESGNTAGGCEPARQFTLEAFKMVTSQKIRQANSVAHALRLIGVLFFIAMAFQIITWKYAMFGGLACFIIAPAIRRILLGEEEGRAQ
jgi:hypothetical protein